MYGATKQRCWSTLVRWTAIATAMACLLCTSKAQAHVDTSKAKPAKVAKVQCTTHYTSCVLSCNKETVTQSNQARGAHTTKGKAKAEQALANTHANCIPQCYRVHCLGQTAQAKAAKKAQKARKVAKK